MYVIGLTGGIASGKSTVSTILEQLGARIIDADKIARQIVEPGEPAWQEIVAHFGRKVLLPDGHLNRNILGDIVFNSQEQRTILNQMTHKRVREQIAEMVEQARLAGCSVVVADVPLLLESGFDGLVDEVWVVYASTAVQLSRLMDRNNLTVAEAAARVASQMALAEKCNYAAVVIDNSGSREATRQQVIDAWHRVSAMTGNS